MNIPSKGGLKTSKCYLRRMPAQCCSFSVVSPVSDASGSSLQAQGASTTSVHDYTSCLQDTAEQRFSQVHAILPRDFNQHGHLH